MGNQHERVMASGVRESAMVREFQGLVRVDRGNRVHAEGHTTSVRLWSAYVDGRTRRWRAVMCGVTTDSSSTERLLPVLATSGEQVHKHLPFPRDHKHSTGPSHVVRVRPGRGELSSAGLRTTIARRKKQTTA